MERWNNATNLELTPLEVSQLARTSPPPQVKIEKHLSVGHSPIP